MTRSPRRKATRPPSGEIRGAVAPRVPASRCASPFLQTAIPELRRVALAGGVHGEVAGRSDRNIPERLAIGDIGEVTAKLMAALSGRTASYMVGPPVDCRRSAQMASASSPTETTPSTTLISRHGPRLGRAAWAARVIVLAVEPPVSAAANSAAVPKRSAGSFWSAMATACSTAAGTLFRCA